MTTIDDFLNQQLQSTAALIANYNAAIAFLTANPTESYKLDTGQSEQEVKYHNVDNLQKARSRLMNEYVVLCQRLNTAPTISIPGW